MQTELNPHEARLLGVLIEKAYTTPDQYPLSLNAAMNGCNQKSNRDPVVDFSQAEVLVGLQGLQMKQLAGSSQGSRVEKWHHNAREHFALGEREIAVLAELLMRGPQTRGELRQRANRMRPIPSLEDLGAVIATLEEKGFLRHMGPGPGSRADRVGQTLAAGLHPDGEAAPTSTRTSPDAATPRPAPPRSTGLEERVRTLEEQVERLQFQMVELCSKLGETLVD